MRKRLLPLIVVLPPVFWQTPTHPLVGTWTLSMSAFVRGADGAPAPVTLTGTLVVTQRAESLIAELQLEPVPGQPRAEALRMASARRDGAVAFTSVSMATLQGGTEVLSRRSTSRYEFDAAGDQLRGTLTIDVEGIPGIPPRSLSGTRVSGSRDVSAAARATARSRWAPSHTSAPRP